MTAQAELAVGAAVKLHSLQAKPELNGRSGLIVTALDTPSKAKGYRVRMKRFPSASAALPAQRSRC